MLLNKNRPCDWEPQGIIQTVHNKTNHVGPADVHLHACPSHSLKGGVIHRNWLSCCFSDLRNSENKSTGLKVSLLYKSWLGSNEKEYCKINKYQKAKDFSKQIRIFRDTCPPSPITFPLSNVHYAPEKNSNFPNMCFTKMRQSGQHLLKHIT